MHADLTDRHHEALLVAAQCAEVLRVRHLYGYELETTRVLTLARGVPPLLARVQQAREALSVWLASQTPDT